MRTNQESREPAREERASRRSFVRSLFEGRLEEDLIFPFPRIRAEERENLDLLLDAFRKFADRRIDGAAIDAEAKMPREVIDGLFEMGIMGMTIPEEHGGSGMSIAAYCRVMEEITRRCASTSATVGGHQSLGYKGILLFGTAAQKGKYLPRLARGELLAAFALTEPTSGSDAASLQATAVRDPGRKAYVLNGTKRWTTNGGIANLFTVFVRTPEARRPGGGEPISAFLVERAFPGVASGREEKKMGLRGSSTTDLILENAVIPEENLLGEPGRGFRVAMEVLNTGRLSLSACCLGAAKEMIDRSVAHARERVQFGRPIAEFEMVQDKIAEMMADTYAAESLIYATAGLVERAEPVDFSVESSICKVFTSEALWRVIQHAVQINGGNGFMRDYPYERFLRDARVNLIFEGTNEILRHFVALSGMSRRGRRLREVGRALEKPMRSMGVLTDFAADRIRRAVRTDRFEAASPALAAEAGRVGEYARGLAGAADQVLREHGEKIVEREFLQQRLADAAIDLYAMSCAISRASAGPEAGGAGGGETGILLCRLFCDSAWRRVRRSLRQVEQNNDADRAAAARLACREGGYRL